MIRLKLRQLLNGYVQSPMITELNPDYVLHRN